MITTCGPRIPPVPNADGAWLSPTILSLEKGRAESRLVNQSLRRANVFAAVRRRLVSEGYRGITMRMIASDCDTTTQTVFNLVGNKSDLLTAAIADYATSLGVTALNWNSYPANSLGLTDAIWESARCNPEYVREATFGFATLSQYSSRCVRAGGTSVVAASLSDIRERFRSGRHFEAVVGSITSLISSAVFDWAQGRINIAALRSQMLERVALVLVGAVDVEKGMEIDAWIGEALRD